MFRHYAAIAFILTACDAPAQNDHSKHTAANVVEISPTLVASGQPTAEGLGTLKARGFGAVINLAPASSPSAVKDEQQIVTRQGLSYAYIPVQFSKPTEADFEAFAAAMRATGERKVLVHCEVNMRASAMVFLYRVIKLKEDPRKAYDVMAGVWVPEEGPWRKLIEQLLRKHNIAFEML
jgi:protein tyrosine phosphatase (PTP) superfamily phosphohydrolase (DUF442 family)